jgi:hypothetical protein
MAQKVSTRDTIAGFNGLVSKMTNKDECVRGSVDIAVLAILSTLEVLLFLTAWTKLVYSTVLFVSVRSAIDTIIVQYVPFVQWIWLCLPDLNYDPRAFFPISIITSPLGIFALIVLVSAVWLRHQLTNLWVAMKEAKAQELWQDLVESPTINQSGSVRYRLVEMSV